MGAYRGTLVCRSANHTHTHTRTHTRTHTSHQKEILSNVEINLTSHLTFVRNERTCVACACACVACVCWCACGKTPRASRGYLRTGRVSAGAVPIGRYVICSALSISLCALEPGGRISGREKSTSLSVLWDLTAEIGIFFGRPFCLHLPL